MDMDLLTFTGINFEDVRVVMIDDEPWYVASDVTRELGFKNSRDVVNYYVSDKCDKKYLSRDDLMSARPTLGLGFNVPNRGLTIINESGMYALLFAVPMKTKSTDPTVIDRINRAHAFKRLVTHEILPTIRNTGAYRVKPMRKWSEVPAAERDFYKNDALTILRRDYDDAEEILDYAFFGFDLAVSDGLISIEQFAKAISGAYNIGQNRLFSLLRDKGYLMANRLKSSRWNSPKQSEIKAGRMTVGILINDKVSYTRTFVTMKGLKYYMTKIDAWLDEAPGKAHRNSLIVAAGDVDSLVWNLFPDARPDIDPKGFYMLRHTAMYDLRLKTYRHGIYLNNLN